MVEDEKCKECAGCQKQTRWREDFPIPWEKDEYVSRREMVKFLSLGSLLIAGANLIAAAHDIPATGSLLFRYPTAEDPCILIRDRAGKALAYSQVCTHLSCSVVHRPEENTLFCPCHHGYFSVEEGRPKGGPPTRPLPQIKLEQIGDDLFAVGVKV
jgi:nitrite reductase/ring-hydroxylating ferredoxin subunit